MPPCQRDPVIIVAATDHRGHRDFPAAAALDHTAITVGDTLLGNTQSSQRVMLENIHPGIIQHQLRTHRVQQGFQRFEHRVQVIPVTHAQRQSHIQIAFLLAHRKVIFAMDGTGNRSWLIGKHGGGAITLMDIAIENQQSLHCPTGQELLRRKSQVIEDAETGTEIVMGMMGAPRQMTGQSLFQGQLGGKQGAHGRDTGAFYQPLTPRQSQASPGFRVQAAGNNLHPVSQDVVSLTMSSCIGMSLWGGEINTVAASYIDKKVADIALEFGVTVGFDGLEMIA